MATEPKDVTFEMTKAGELRPEEKKTGRLEGRKDVILSSPKIERERAAFAAYRKARIAYAKGNFGDALNISQKLIKMLPDNPKAKSMLYRSEIKTGNLSKEGAKYFDKMRSERASRRMLGELPAGAIPGSEKSSDEKLAEAIAALPHERLVRKITSLPSAGKKILAFFMPKKEEIEQPSMKKK